MTPAQRKAARRLDAAAVLLLEDSERLSAVGALNTVTDDGDAPAGSEVYLIALGALAHVVLNTSDPRPSKLATPGIGAAEGPLLDAAKFLREES